MGRFWGPGNLLHNDSAGSSAGGSLAAEAARGIKAAMRSNRSVRSVCVGLIGDSTGTDTDEWFGLLWSKYAAKYPAWSLLWRTWNDATQDYNLPEVLQLGTAGERYAEYAGGGAQRFVYPTARASDDLDVRVKCSRPVWASGGGTGTQTLISRWDTAAGAKSWYVWLDGTGKVNYNWSADGTANTGTVASSVGVGSAGFVDGQPGWIRVTHDLDNGASGNTVQFFTSTDGVTWTQLGTDRVTAGATSLGPSTTDIRLASSSYTASNFFTGRLYWVEYRPGTLGAVNPSIIPPLPDDYDQTTTASSVQFGGAPVLMLLNGSISGQNIAYFDDATRRVKLTPPHGQRLQFISTNHNEGNNTGERWTTPLNTFVTNVKNRLGNIVPVVLVTQNPCSSGLTPPNQIVMRAARGQALMSYALATPGVYGVDTYEGFPPDVTALIETDGVHPTKGWNGGSGVWANAVAEQMGLT